ncbi:hypothetical protein Pfo_020744 [Paulownia fortunei]|nr:hypothetical protein Pfo_020744 [Paulownia fortunei]
MEYFATGMRFQPSEEERIAYLLYKVNGKPLPRNNFIFISTVDLYGDKEPWEICQDSGNHENYFFTRLKKIDDGPKCCRDIGRGRLELNYTVEHVFSTVRIGMHYEFNTGYEVVRFTVRLIKSSGAR